MCERDQQNEHRRRGRCREDKRLLRTRLRLRPAQTLEQNVNGFGSALNKLSWDKLRCTLAWRDCIFMGLRFGFFLEIIGCLAACRSLMAPRPLTLPYVLFILMFLYSCCS